MIIFLIFGMFLSLSFVVNGKEYFTDVNFYEKEIENFIWKEYEGYYSWNEISDFDEEGTFGDYEKYAFVDTTTPYPQEGEEQFSKIFIFEKYKGGVKKIWESIKFPGFIYYFCSTDLNHKGNREFVVFTQSKGKDGQKKYQAWIFIWNRENSYMIYPKDIKDNKLTSAKRFEILDYDRDYDDEFIVTSKVSEGTYMRFYTFKNDKLVLEREDFYTGTLKNAPSKKKTIDEKYPLITKYLRNKYKDIEIFRVETIGVSYKYYAVTSIGQIVLYQEFDSEKKEYIVHEWYNLSEKYKQVTYFKRMDPHIDVNKDGIDDNFLIGFSDETEVIQKCYYYIFTFTSDGCKLLSPIDENRRSLMWTIKVPIDFTRDQNDSLVIVTHKFSEEELKNQFWIWNETEQQIIEYPEFENQLDL